MKEKKPKERKTLEVIKKKPEPVTTTVDESQLYDMFEKAMNSHIKVKMNNINWAYKTQEITK